MKPALTDDVWKRRGISLIWDADALASLLPPKRVVSLRRLLSLHRAGWPDDIFGDADTSVLAVAGIESAIDALPPDDATHWLEQEVYRAIVSFQQEVSDGGNQAALIFWIAEPKRLTYNTSDDTYYWHCSTEFRGQQIPLSRCLFNGAQQDLRQIREVRDKNPHHWIGLYHPRIS